MIEINNGAVEVQPIETLDEAAILELLRVHGERIASLNAQIAPLEVEFIEVMTEVERLYNLYRSQSKSIAAIAGSLIQTKPPIRREKRDARGGKIGKRANHNPIKNLNIGVRRSYEWKEFYDYTPDEALGLVYERMLNKAIEKGIHSCHCECAGRTKHCTASHKLYVSVQNDLPKEVVAKIEETQKKYVEQYKARKAEEARLGIDNFIVPTLSAAVASNETI